MILVRFYVRLHTVPITHSLTYKNTMQYSSITILPTNRKINKITHTTFLCMMAYDAIDGSIHDNKTFNLYTEKMIPYSSMMILPTNHKIKKITHTAFFLHDGIRCLYGSIHDYRKGNVTQGEDDAIRVRRRFLHDSLSPLMVISLVFLELVEQIELALTTYVTF